MSSPGVSSSSSSTDAIRGTSVQRLALLAAAGAAAGGALLACHLYARRRTVACDVELEADIVAFSSRLIAAERALESARAPEVRLCYDPLAELLAGPRAIARVQERQGRSEEASQRPTRPDAAADATTAAGASTSVAASASSRRGRHTGGSSQHPRPRIPIRTRFFDDWLERLGEGKPPGTTVTGATAPACRPAAAGLAVRQTVLLGAGMDARAFRLQCFRRGQDADGATPTPPVRVFELDQPEVVRIKTRLIDGALAQGSIPPPACQRVTVPCDFSVTRTDAPAEPEAEPASSSSSSSDVTLSLVDRARSFLFGSPPPPPPAPAAAAAVHWTRSLIAAGFTSAAPSAWLLEGLLMYLTEEEQLALVADISRVAAVGSQLGLSHVNRQALRNATRAPTTPTTPTAATDVTGNPNTSPSPSPAVPPLDSTSSRPGRSIAPQYRSLLMSWRSYLSPAFLAALERHGWTIHTLTQLGAPDANYGAWSAEVFPIEDESKGRVLYLLAEKVR